MRQQTSGEDAFDIADGNNSWDCFVGPAAMMQDDRYPTPFLPFMMAAKTMAFAAEMNSKFIEGLARTPRGH